MATLLFDLRSAVRALAKRPGLTLVAAVTLALGIGANTAIFSVVRGVLLRPFPFEEPERLVVVWETFERQGLPKMYAAPPNFVDWRRDAASFSSMAGFAPRDVALGDRGEHAGIEEVSGARVTAGLFDTLGIAPARGRTFTAEDDRPGAPPTVLLSHDLWTRRFGADPGLVGGTIQVDGEARQVIGVLPPGFVFPPGMSLEGTPPAESAELWVPFATDMTAIGRGAHFMTAIGRLAPGVSREVAEAELAGIAQALAEQYPDDNDGWSIALTPLTDEMLGRIEPALWLLLGAVALVLLIACVNVANLLLASGTDRHAELAVRRALGASGGRLVGQVLTESLLLALAGGVAGLLAARWSVGLLVALAPDNVPRLQEVAIDLPVLAFAAAVSVLTGLLFGAIPALRVAREGRVSLLPSERAGTAGRSASRLGDVLVVAEVALALMLLVGAGLLTRSFLELRGVDPGFEPARTLTLRTTLPQEGYSGRESWPERAAAFDRLRHEIEAIPGVTGAGFVLELPLDADRQGTSVGIEGVDFPEDFDNRVNFTFATAGYFDAMGIPITDGRPITEADRAGTERVVVVNTAFVRRFLGGERAVGRTVYVHFEGTDIPRRVVGIVGDVLHDSLGRDPYPAVYVPYAQVPYSRGLALAVATDLPPRDALPTVTASLRRAEPGLAISKPRVMEEIVGAAVATPRFISLLLGAFAAVALALAAVGVYGVISYAVRRRTREIGVRVALGADRASILGLVVKRGMVPVAIGLVLGVAGSLALHRLVERFLFQVSATDPVLYAGLAAFLTATALAACLIPARRATTVDPKVALEEM